MGTLDGRLYSSVVWRFTLDPRVSQDRQRDPFTLDPQASQDRQQEGQVEDGPAEPPELPYNRCQFSALQAVRERIVLYLRPKDRRP